MKKIITAILIMCVGIANAQSPDSRICNCRAQPISNDFMNATTVKIAGVSSLVVPWSTLTPQEGQTLNFVVPKMVSKPGCTSRFTMSIFDDSTNATILETSSANNSFSYNFGSCTKKYRVELLSFTTSAAGNDGNCRRSITFYVIPKCLTQQCNCFNLAAKAGKLPASGDLNIDGSLVCRTATSTQRSYTLRYMIFNKTNCNLKVESITVHGQTAVLPVYNIGPKGKTAFLTEVITTPVAVAAPTTANVRITVKYSLNGKKCSTSMDLVYENCK